MRQSQGSGRSTKPPPRPLDRRHHLLRNGAPQAANRSREPRPRRLGGAVRGPPLPSTARVASAETGGPTDALELSVEYGAHAATPDRGPRLLRCAIGQPPATLQPQPRK